MSVFDVLDATRLCARWSEPLDSPTWVLPAPPTPDRVRPQAAEDYSWRMLAGNPRALLLTGVVGGMLAVDGMVRAVISR